MASFKAHYKAFGFIPRLPPQSLDTHMAKDLMVQIGQRRQKEVTWGLSHLLFFPLTRNYEISCCMSIWNSYIEFQLMTSLRKARLLLSAPQEGTHTLYLIRVLEIWAHWSLGLLSYHLHPSQVTAQPVWILPRGPGDCCWALCSLIKSHRMTPRRMRKVPTRKAGMMMISYCCSWITR